MVIDDLGIIKWEVVMDSVLYYVLFYGEKSIVVFCERELELKCFLLFGIFFFLVDIRFGLNFVLFIISYFFKNDMLFFCLEMFNYCDIEFVYLVKLKKLRL